MARPTPVSNFTFLRLGPARARRRPVLSGQTRPRRSGRLTRAVALVMAGALLFGFGYVTGSQPLPGPQEVWQVLSAGTGSGTSQAWTLARPGDATVGTAAGGASQDGVGWWAEPQSPYGLLLASQLPSGAFRVKPDDSRIVPYFANIAAIALVERRPLDVRAYLEWYLGHLNRPDRWGLLGTIYDYEVEPGGIERPTDRYDSADSYAATFLSLLRAYVDATGDRDFARSHLQDIELVASVVARLQDKDGLVWANAAKREKYLMDNAEDYRGLEDWADVLTGLGLDDAATAARATAGRIAQAIELRLWDERRGNYDWAIYTFWLGSHPLEIRRESSWRSWYPDTVAQVFPVVEGLLQPSDPRAVALYENLNTWHPGWVNQAKRDPNPWSVLGYAAAVMGDRERALAFARATAAAYFNQDGPYAGLSWELSWYLRTLVVASGEDVFGPGTRINPPAN